MAKHDADNLRADLDDGYAKVSNLLIEMLACAPLTATEMRVVFFIMRRTYGWARGADRNTGKADIMTAEDIARGTGRPVSTVEKALGALVKQRVVVQIATEPRPGAKCAYGINVQMSEWGNNTDWREARIAHREAYQGGVYGCRNLQPSSCGNQQLSVAEPGNLQLPKSATETGKQLPNPATETGNEANGHRGKNAPTDITSTKKDTEEERAREDFGPENPNSAHPRHPVLRAARDFYGRVTPPGGWDRYDQELLGQLEIAGDRLPEAEIVAVFDPEHPNRPLPGEWPDKLVKRIMEADDGDPIVAEFVKLVGPRPDDDYTGMEIWDLRLERFRAERTA